MEFEEAKQTKESIGDTSDVMGTVGYVAVTPDDQNDLDRYLEHAFNEWPFPVPDEDAKLFCRNHTYKVRALRLDDSGVLIRKDL